MEFHKLHGIKCTTSGVIVRPTTTAAIASCKERSDCYGVYNPSCISGSSLFILCGTGTSNKIETGRSSEDCLRLKIDFAGN